MRKSKRISPETVDKIWKMRNEGKKHKEISKELRVSQACVAEHLNGY